MYVGWVVDVESRKLRRGGEWPNIGDPRRGTSWMGEWLEGWRDGLN